MTGSSSYDDLKGWVQEKSWQHPKIAKAITAALVGTSVIGTGVGGYEVHQRVTSANKSEASTLMEKLNAVTSQWTTERVGDTNGDGEVNKEDVAATTVSHPDGRIENINEDSDSYLIQDGDSVSAIALKFGLSWPDLANLNGLTEPYIIRAGDVLKIPKVVVPVTGEGVSTPVPGAGAETETESTGAISSAVSGAAEAMREFPLTPFESAIHKTDYAELPVIRNNLDLIDRVAKGTQTEDGVWLTTDGFAVAIVYSVTLQELFVTYPKDADGNYPPALKAELQKHANMLSSLIWMEGTVGKGVAEYKRLTENGQVDVDMVSDQVNSAYGNATGFGGDQQTPLEAAVLALQTK